MKLKLLIAALIFPCIALAQQPDTVGVAKAVDSLLQVAYKLSNKGAFDRALEICQAASQVVLAKLGRETPAYGNVCSAYGSVFDRQGNFRKAEEWLLRALEINGKALGKGHISYAQVLNSLGFLYTKSGNFSAAEQLFIEAIKTYEANFGKAHPRYAKVALNLGRLYSETGNYEKAESLFLEVNNLFESGLIDKKNRLYDYCLHEMAILYNDLGLYQKAEHLYQQRAEVVKNSLGEDHPEYGHVLSNWALVYSYMKRYDEAESLLLRAKTIMDKAGETETTIYAEITGHLGQIYFQQNQLAKAEPLLEQSWRIEEKLSGQQHYRTALGLMALAGLNWKKDDTQKAEEQYLEALAICETSLGKDHKYSIGSAQVVADFYWSLHRFSEAIPLIEESSEGEKSRFVKAAQYLSERELSEHIKSFSESQSTAFSFAQSQLALSALSFDNALFYKGFLLNAAQQLRGMATQNPASAEKLVVLKSLQGRLAGQYAAPIAERDSTTVAELEAKANNLEKEIAREVAGYSEAIRQVRWQEVQTALKPGEVAIEFVDYQYFDPKPTDSVMYGALIVLPGAAQPQFISLFEKKELLPLLRGATGGNNFLKINALYASKPFAEGQKSPYELIWKPLEQALKNISTVYCSPSGLLHYLNLAAIPTPDGKPFGDARHLVLLGSTRSLVIPNTANSYNIADAYLAGGIRYESDSSPIAYALREVGTRSANTAAGPVFQPDSSATRAGDLNYLPATATEVREIGQMLRAANFSAKVDTGFFASEEAFRSVGIGKPSPRILHLATHGYFFPDPKGKKANAGQEPVFKMSEHPMIRSGLIMAGAKQAWLTGKHPEGQEDGILTAYEISQMNLSNTELVVLSACETGLGQVSGNEGVYGLQRAFKIAGVKYLIMSLWKVDDRSTQAFMAEFYKQWLQGKQAIPEAFRAAQKAIRVKSPSPYDWAGFVLIE